MAMRRRPLLWWYVSVALLFLTVIGCVDALVMK